MKVRTEQETEKVAVFMMGVSGCGKTTVAHKMYGEHSFVDPDELMKLIPGYTDECPERFHYEGAEMAETLFQQYIAEGEARIVVDGTGTDSGKMVRRMADAKMKGYQISLVYVIAPLEVCLERNRRRTRRVPDAVVIQKARDIDTAFRLIAPHADSVKVVNTA